ncbi:MAG: EamA family transporter [Bacilli bacterium]|nr:EamA family transporter [Bacilli bacterium]
MWFIYAIITLLLWALADLFYKKGADEKDKYSHLKTGIMVGFVMGIYATIYIIMKDINFNFLDIIKYLPVSFFYILSMIIGYKGLRYLQLSISSPIQNCSGVITSLLLLIIFRETLGLLDIIGIFIIFIGVLALSIVEKNNSEEKKNYSKKVVGLIALIFPILYCILDGMGTFLDAVYLDKLQLISEDAALIAYEYTFFIYGLVLFIYLIFIKKEKIAIKNEKDRLGASIFETIGQFFYVFAVSSNSTLSIPIIASYSIVSILLARIFLKEKLNKNEYLTIFIVLFGIIILGISEGISG